MVEVITSFARRIQACYLALPIRCTQKSLNSEENVRKQNNLIDKGDDKGFWLQGSRDISGRGSGVQEPVGAAGVVTRKQRFRRSRADAVWCNLGALPRQLHLQTCLSSPTLNYLP